MSLDDYVEHIEKLDELTEKISQRFKGFTDGIRVVMLIDRGVMNANKGSKRWINKIITHDHDSWISAVRRLLELQYHILNPDVRMYSCINDRKLDQGIKHFQHLQLDVLPEQKLRFYTKINNTFCSALMKPEQKNSRYFLLDVDIPEAKAQCYIDVYEEINKFIADNGIKNILDYDTKKGRHYIVEPFDMRLTQDLKHITVQKDGLLLLHWIKE